MAMFVWVGTGTAVSANHAQYNGESEVAFSSTILLPIAMAFGFGITVLAGNLGAYSGGHVNPAVTLADGARGQVGGTFSTTKGYFGGGSFRSAPGPDQIHSSIDGIIFSNNTSFFKKFY